MSSKCLLCKKDLQIGESTIKLVNGKVKQNIFGGYQFIEDEAFEVQGYVHTKCMLDNLRENHINREKNARIDRFI